MKICVISYLFQFFLAGDSLFAGNNPFRTIYGKPKIFAVVVANRTFNTEVGSSIHFKPQDIKIKNTPKSHNELTETTHETKNER